MSRRAAARRLVLAAVGAALVPLASRLLRQLPGGTGPRWQRTNFRGAPVSLQGGPALALAATTTAAVGAARAPVAAAALVAGLGAGGLGLYDDLVGQRPDQQAKGLHGHLAALRRGQVTSGTVKLVGLAGVGLAAAGLLEACRPAAGRRRSRAATAARVLLGAGVVAGSANLVNLLDLRPGRALKVGLLAGAGLASGTAGSAGDLVSGPVGACLGALPSDLAERTMLGDSGANALGALLGLALAARSGTRGRAAALAVISLLTVASERVSFTRVIARTPVLRELDRLGRRPEEPTDG